MRTIRPSIPALLLALAAGVGVAPADTPVRVLLTDLRLEQNQLIELDENAVLIRDADGRPARVAIGTVVALSAGGPATLPAFSGLTASTRVYVELIDGQRLAVDIAASEDPEAIVGRVIGLGQGRIPLERITRITRPGELWHAETPQTDIVRLTNGDVLTGFVDAVGVSVSVESDTGAIATVPFDRVAEILLANPTEPTTGLFVSDDQGVTLRARAVSVDASGRLRVITEPGVLGVDSGGEDTIAYERANARLLGLRAVVRTDDTGGWGHVLPLASIEATDIRPTGDRRWTPQPTTVDDQDPMIAIPDVHMPAPASVVYPLPPGAGTDHFACGVIAAAPGPWTDCIARVYAENAEGTRTLIGEQHVTTNTNAVTIEGPILPGTRAVVLEVDPGQSGAVQDAVTFLAPRLRTGL